MDLEKRKALIKDFNEFKTRKYKFQKARNAQERNTAERELTNTIEKLREYDLHQFDPCIELETYDLDGLQYDINEIIIKKYK